MAIADLAAQPATAHQAREPEDFLAGLAHVYLSDVAAAARAVPGDLVASAIRLLARARSRGNTVYVFGNGGSAAIASHCAVDLVKTAMRTDTAPLRAVCLSDATPICTAVANDIAYSEVFAAQLRWMARPGDVVLAISSSGRSANIVAGLEAARELGLESVALVGFSGGPAAGLADIVVHVPIADYGVVEDVHAAVCHGLARGLAAVAPDREP